MTTATAPGLRTRLLPAHTAYDYEHFRNLLAEPDLVDSGVAVCLFRAPLLAVPVSDARRGGYMSFDLLTLALNVHSLLGGRPGFPDLRVRWSPYPDTCHTVEWGEEPPMWDNAERGRFYGYREDAISEFLRQRPAPLTPSSTFTNRSPTAP